MLFQYFARDSGNIIEGIHNRRTDFAQPLDLAFMCAAPTQSSAATMREYVPSKSRSSSVIVCRDDDIRGL